MPTVSSSPQAFASFIRQDIAIWEEVADQARVEVKQDSCCRRACSVAHANDCDGISTRSTKCRERGNFDGVYTCAA